MSRVWESAELIGTPINEMIFDARGVYSKNLERSTTGMKMSEKAII